MTEGGPDTAQALLEPMVGVGIGVERSHVAKAGAAVEVDGLFERSIRFEPNDSETEAARLGLQRLQHAPADAQPAHRVGDPHSLEGSHRGRHRLDRAARHRLPVHRRHEEGPSRWNELARFGGRLAAGSNPLSKRRSSSSKYRPMHQRAGGLAGSTRRAGGRRARAGVGPPPWRPRDARAARTAVPEAGRRRPRPSADSFLGPLGGPPPSSGPSGRVGPGTPDSAAPGPSSGGRWPAGSHSRNPARGADATRADPLRRARSRTTGATPPAGAPARGNGRPAPRRAG